VDAVVAAFEVAGLRLILTSASGRVVAMNAAAEASLAASGLVARDGILAAATELDSRRLRESLRAARTRCPIVVTGREVATAAQLDELGLVMVILSQEAPAASAAECSPIHLTPAETRLLRAIVKGERLTDFARRSGVKTTTVKTHLQNLFDKTGERRQADLVRRALSDAGLKAVLD